MAKSTLPPLRPELNLSGFGRLLRESRTDWLRLRTLILLRWMAITGQIAAVFLAQYAFQVNLPQALCYSAIGILVLANLVSVVLFPENTRLSEGQALLTLLFDLTQLAVLLYLTGGMNNPFALLVLAPVTVSATALDLRTTVVLGAAAICMVTLNAFFYLPLRLGDGTVLTVPALFDFGFWAAIVVGILFLGVYSRRVATEIRSMSDALLATQMALAREQKLTDLGGVVAATAHELGTPLATIKLISSELIDDLADRPEQRDDARLIRAQADRCRDILRSMGRAGKDDRLLRQAALGTVLREAAEPHLERGKRVTFELRPAIGGAAREPIIRRSPEVIHGLRNLIQNAVDFSRSAVWIDAVWGGHSILVRISDDGDGFPLQVIGRIGEPFVRDRRSAQDLERRPEYEGMGLGLFIAKTLLERSGAELTFANGLDPFLTREENPERCGAIIELVWPADRLLAPTDQPLGENTPIEA
ncbi:MAG: ActS/PrrB/RegB family redox-sensitive histidine kinase [Pseudorhodobacter sp.]|nr:ActS/PrrB/RegB family redox-sensitive histidine kinase [Pseudorhodobacter sp.]